MVSNVGMSSSPNRVGAGLGRESWTAEVEWNSRGDC